MSRKVTLGKMQGRSVNAIAMGGNDVLTIDQLVHQDDWVCDSERYRCHVCTRNFSHFRRKHHCRKVNEKYSDGIHLSEQNTE
jgi:hypothetical protein